MLDAILSIGNPVLVCALIAFSAGWAEREREFFGNGHVRWEHLE